MPSPKPIPIPKGTRFGQLTVLSPAPKNPKRPGSRFHCRCDCGKKTIAYGYALRRGHTHSCGCYRRPLPINDLTGMKFNRLTALRIDAEHKGSPIHWICRCKCGNEISVRGSSLVEQNTKSCGCYRAGLGKLAVQLRYHSGGRIDMPGRVFGKLKVIRGPSGTGNDRSWLCDCDCGRRCWVRQRSLTSNHTKSCGCMKRKGSTRTIRIKRKMAGDVAEALRAG